MARAVPAGLRAAPKVGRTDRPVGEYEVRTASADEARSVAAAVGSRAHRMSIGLRPLGARPWIEDQWDFGAQLRERAQLVDTHDDVVAGESPEHEAIVELRDLLLGELPRDLPAHYRIGSQRTARVAGPRPWIAPLAQPWPSDAQASPLAQIARAVPDDLCLMQRDRAGDFRLLAASVCFPTRWSLLPKMGRDLGGIHAPVPEYQERIGPGVEQVFDRLTAARTLVRVNWSLTDSPALYQPARLARGLSLDGIDDADLGHHLWLRTERQSVRALARTGAVVFSIRIRQLTLVEACAADPGLAERLIAQFESMGDRLRKYKGLVRTGPRVMGWLTAMVAQPRGSS